jgi:phage/plasmid primase-like uncharacterized protein
MGNLSNILPGNWKEQPAEIITDPEVQVKDAMIIAGLNPPEHIIFDGNLHKFISGTTGTGKYKRPGWYVMHDGSIKAGMFGCFRADVRQLWREDVGRQLSEQETHNYQIKQEQSRKIYREEKEKSQEIAAIVVKKIWEKSSFAEDDHPYLKNKNIKCNGAKISGDGRLIIPLYDISGQISSLQYIDTNGNKMYHKGGATSGKFWSIGSVREHDEIYVAEGFATACTIHETTQKPCIVAYSANNIQREIP